jgi:hypothetical protein
MAFSFVGAGSAVVAHFDSIPMRPTVPSGVESNAGVSGLGSGRGLWRGRVLSISKERVGGCEGCDTSREGCDRPGERCVCLN